MLKQDSKRESRSTRRKIKIDEMIENKEKQDSEVYSQQLLDNFGLVAVDPNEPTIPKEQTPEDSAYEIFQKILHPKKMEVPLSEITTMSRLKKLPSRDQHDPLNDMHVYELKIKQPHISAYPVVESLDEYLRCCIYYLSKFEEDRHGHNLDEIDIGLFWEHVTNSYSAILNLSKSLNDIELERMLVYLSGQLACRLFFHKEAKELIRSQRLRLNHCSDMIQKLLAADIFRDDLYANRKLWKRIAVFMDLEVGKIPTSNSEYSVLEPELTYLIDFCDLKGYSPVEPIIMELFTIFNTFESISPGRKTESILMKLQKRLRPYVSERRVMIRSIRRLNIIRNGKSDWTP